MSEHDNTLLPELIRDLIKERRASRRLKLLKYSFWGTGLLLVAGAVLVEHLQLDEAAEAKQITAVIQVRGEIADGAEANAAALKKAIGRAFDDERAKAVVLKINSPGGSPVQAGQVFDEIKRQRGLHPKVPVYAVIEDLGASGAYYIAAAADEIVADKASLVGSIGVTAASFGFVDLMNRVGVERRAYTSGAHKAFLDPFQPKNPEETVFWNDVLKQTHQQFIQSVKTGRGDRLKDAGHPELFSGLIWTGEQAKQLGLIDKLGDVDYVARDLVGATSQVDFTVKDNAFDRFAKRLGASAAQQLSMALGFSGVSLR
ncbi:signal peptide peptidase SppA [Pseudomonas sp. PLB05]|uniref:signal peptide peptidase SppA n=1 Tax=Pseudomonas sp. PLB05 TaxID=2899078 RepID=UPI001E2CAE26|nr:signal peptide peptidase SppA [Pseudomonas sp. PLB05]MCD4866981.1 signal peptide peptidase SppA [Pseudomonas sp. PLB05]